MRTHKWHPAIRLRSGWFRRIGQILVLPIAALLLAGLLMTAGDWLGRAGLASAGILTQGGFVLVDQFPLLVAICLAAGLSGQPSFTAALAGAAAWLVLDASGTAVYGLLSVGSASLAPFEAGILGGLLAGALAGILVDLISQYQKRLTLPGYLDFFAGAPLTLLLAALAALPAGLLCGAAWSFLQHALTALAGRLIAAGAGGAFIYGFLNRLLLPLGLHHALNQAIWLNWGDFTSQAGILVQGDLNRFFAGDPTAGRYTAGYFPLMIFVLPAMAAACLLTARRLNRRRILPVLAIAGLVALLSGVTEPLEILLLFTAPALYLIEALLSGLSQLVCYQLQVHAGFRFSAGLSDYLANWPQAINPERIWQVGLVLAVLAFAAAYLAIVFLKLNSPGRESAIEPAASPAADTEASIADAASAGAPAEDTALAEAAEPAAPVETDAGQ